MVCVCKSGFFLKKKIVVDMVLWLVCLWLVGWLDST